ncbi:MAG: bifunctional methylenetetrahydrofolate dehydrogenase/methenyltetrahydrofolate cyclohydrolase [Phycisphaeraceae bacterium]|nr:bifunctional methylenetetrahydrofolate dehydrogenase/methenyltetrahydrofolate cyclohydrolase [Phycisphaeraceae bacterium]
MIRLLTGKEPAAALASGLKEAVARLHRPPHLAVVRAGDDPASARYVRGIARRAEKAGIEVGVRALDATATYAEFVAATEAAGNDPAVDAVQVQKPVPEGRHTSEVVERISATKDVEGIHPENQGLLLLGRPRYIPCTAAAVVRLLQHHGVPLAGKNAVVVGRSDILGKPLATLLLGLHATVTVCHTRTANLADEVARADLVIAAAGSPELVRAEWIAEGAVVVDVGHHVLDDGRTVGDVQSGAETRASAITPVPGGVGPLTVIELLSNVVAAAAHHCATS